MIGGRSALLSAASGPGYGNWTGNYENVSLLLRGGTPALIPLDESPSPKDIVVVGRPSINTTLFKYGDSALDFPGALGNYYSIFGLNNFTPGLGAWTVEAWIYPKSTADWVIMSGSNFYLQRFGTSTYVGDGSVNRIAVASVPAVNQWTHVAAVRESSGTIRLFFNGVQQASSTGSLSTATTTGILIGGRTAGAAIGTDALLDDARVTVGVARYTANFTPPTAELPANITDDPNYNDVSLLLRGAETAGPLVPVDESFTTKELIITGSATLSSTVWKYVSPSLAFNGSNSVISSPYNTAFNLSGFDFTIEMWVRQNTQTGIQVPLSYDQGVLSSYRIDIASGNPRWYINSGYAIASTTNLTLNTWHHLAVCRSGSTTRMFLDGIQVGSTTAVFSDPTGTPFLRIGASADNPSFYYPLNGYIDDLRITKGVARYIKKFLPPPAELPAI